MIIEILSTMSLSVGIFHLVVIQLEMTNIKLTITNIPHISPMIKSYNRSIEKFNLLEFWRYEEKKDLCVVIRVII